MAAHMQNRTHAMMTGRHTWMLCHFTCQPVIHMHESLAPLKFHDYNSAMDDRPQLRNAALVAASAVLVTAASYWTGRSAVLLAGARCTRDVLLVSPPHPLTEHNFRQFPRRPAPAVGQGVFVCLVGAALFAAARSLYARHRSKPGRAEKVASSAAALLSRNPLAKQPRPATSEEDRRRRAAAAQAR